MSEPIQRYNQGFGGFGPLEKCNDGKLVTYDDHEELMFNVECEADKKEIEYIFRYGSLNYEIQELKGKLKKANRYFVMQTINVLVLGVTTQLFLWL